VAIVTINLVASAALTRCDQTSTSGQVQDLPLRPWRKPLVKHQVHEHACDRDVKPDWDRPTRDSLMAIPSAAKNLNERDNHQRQRHKSKQNVRRQYREVNCRDPSRVSRRFFADVRVINDVTRQETSRGSHCGDHARHVPAPGAMPNEVPAH
jgi:hypothetical protein